MLGKIELASYSTGDRAGAAVIDGSGAGESRRTSVVQAVEKVERCVVSISSEKKAASHSRWPFSAEENQYPRVSGMGSGVLVDGRGYILTNHHVVDRVQGIEVQLFDGTTYPARVLQNDPVMDLAMLKVDADHTLAAIKIGTSSDLMVGETVITIGNAFGYENTVSVGIVSALHRDVTLSDEQVYRNLIQTDACINPGNSGGSADQHRRGVDRDQRRGSAGARGSVSRCRSTRSSGLPRNAEHATAGVDVAWPGRHRTAEGPRPGVLIAEVQPGSPAEARDSNLATNWFASVMWQSLTPGPRARHAGRPPRPSGECDDPTWHTETGMHLDVQAVAARRTARPRPIPMTWSGGCRDPDPPRLAEYVAAVSPKLRGGLYVQAVSPGSPAAAGAIQKGDILVGMNVGSRHWETIRADNIVYVLRQPETAQTKALLYVVRRNGIQPRRMSLADLLAPSILSR